MNRIVAAWQKHEARPQYDGPDTVDIEDGLIVEVPLKEGPKMAQRVIDPSIGRIAVNRFSVIGLALYGGQDRVEMAYMETARTIKRLGLGKKVDNTQPLVKQPPGGVGGSTSTHDLSRWLDGIQLDKAHEPDVRFLLRLHKTFEKRIPNAKRIKI